MTRDEALFVIGVADTQDITLAWQQYQQQLSRLQTRLAAAPETMKPRLQADIETLQEAWVELYGPGTEATPSPGAVEQLTRAEAAEMLEVAPDAPLEEIETRYRQLYNDYQIRIEAAPTARLREMFERKLHEIQQAYAVLCQEPQPGEQDSPPPPSAQCTLLLRAATPGRVLVDGNAAG